MKANIRPEATREKILDAAEQLFIERGFAATSLRAIATSAAVNLAATHYHFGSKAGLLEEAVHRRVSQINQQRLSLLDELETGKVSYTLAHIISAFFTPLGELGLQGGLNKLMGRLFAEPVEVVKPILEKEFGDTAQRFINAIHHLMPELDLEEVQWRFHFMVGAMIHVLNFDHPIASEVSAQDLGQKLERLEAFVLAGFIQASNPAENKSESTQ